MSEFNITQYEQDASDFSINAVDAYARRTPFPIERESFLDISHYFFNPGKSGELKKVYVDAFLALAGQTHDPEHTNTLLTPSASAGLDIVAKYLKRSGKTKVHVVEPCIDSIPLLFSHEGLALTAFPDDLYTDPEALNKLEGDVVLIVSPNNPTGKYMSEVVFKQLTESCAKKGQMLLFDPSFRLYVPHQQVFDQYKILNESGVSYVVVEDSGKTWPTTELKLGILASSNDLAPELASIASDLWMTQSPFSMKLLTSLVQATHKDNLQSLHRLIRNNQSILRTELDLERLTYDGLPWMSVAWLGLVDMTANAFVETLRQVDPRVGVLPGQGFYWNQLNKSNPGSNHVRIALSRDAYIIATVGKAMGKVLSSPRHS